MKSFLELAKKRKTTYEFSEKKVKNSDILKILEVARWAPSCGNSQPWRFIVIQDEKIIERAVEGTHFINFPFINPLPHTIIAFVLYETLHAEKNESVNTCTGSCSLHNPDHPLCVSMSAENAALAAADIGLETCFITPIRENVSKILEVPKPHEVMLLLGLGYGKKKQTNINREREKLDELIFYEKYGAKNEKTN